MRPADHPPSLWRDTAGPAPAPTALTGEHRADVAIIGGGYTGISAALRCLEHGLEPVVLEAAEIGWGASGRNGGVVSTKFRASLGQIAKHHGVDRARRMYSIGQEAVACVERYVETFGIADAGLRMSGNLRCAHNSSALASLTAEAEISKEVFGDGTTSILNAEAVRQETGSSDFVGGVLVRQAGIIHPLNYVRGLARAVRARGGRIFERSMMIAREKTPNGVRVITQQGSVAARHLVIGTNGYSSLSDGVKTPLRRTIVPFRSAMIATAPLDDEIFRNLMPHNRSYSETRRMMRWFRRVDDRMLFGGRGAFGREDSQSAYLALEKAMKHLFPQLSTVPITHRWSGLVAMTMNSLPQVGSLDKHTHFALGYNGAGVAMSSLMGRYVIDLVTGAHPDLALIGPTRPRTVPFYFLREPAVRLVAGWYQFLDRIGR